MSKLMAAVNQRTNLVGNNRLELLLFRLHGTQPFGINVFKVREVLQCPELTEMPGSSPHVRGIAHLRGVPVMVIDLSQATGGKRIEDLSSAYVLVTEYNRHTQGFLVNGVDRIVNTNWDQILPPPKGAGAGHYLTAVTEIDGKLVQIIDVEKVFSEITPVDEDVSEDVKSKATARDFKDLIVLVADDSAVARNQVKRALSSIGVQVELVNDGRLALDWLNAKAAELGGDISTKVPLLISDIEMPEMDGYTLTAEIKADPVLRNMHVVLHSSLSGVFNEAMVKKVGADQFIAKFHPDELASAVQKWMTAEQ
ncbi:MAG: chemotaxis protein CheW [Alteromonadaceae bacterium]|uniref:chemotaxis protein n=1 Tax=Rheinheimera TaxID=67575 RepID=UPI000C647671|nr:MULTISPECIES: chemotaxis protein [Rheinheimera]MBJ91203.1 chemotaxis protein CheW [Alteromonadaceae bacterium]MCD1598014.1 chemotaxis protein [Rheinheimera aquimaris]HBN90642.1 chemotaxis protein CheW [Rheinheimera sp.]